jgi:hypothetical protein
MADELDETADVARREIMLRVPRIDEPVGLCGSG